MMETERQRALELSDSCRHEGCLGCGPGEEHLYSQVNRTVDFVVAFKGVSRCYSPQRTKEGTQMASCCAFSQRSDQLGEALCGGSCGKLVNCQNMAALGPGTYSRCVDGGEEAQDTY